MNITLNTYALGHKNINHVNKLNANFYGYVGNTGLQKDVFEKNQVSFKGNKEFSPLEIERLEYQPKLAPALKKGIDRLEIIEDNKTFYISDEDEIAKLFPHTYGNPILTLKPTEELKPAKPLKVGVVLSGGQAPGGHNVISGIYDALKEANPNSEVYGFLGGPSGLIEGKYKILTDEIIDNHRNMGGFHMIGSGRTKLEKEEQFERVLNNCKKLGINAIVVIGGDDSNTNAAVLAEWLKERGEDLQVIGCPKTIDGDLKNEHIEASFGFDTATKTYAETIGNIQKDAASAKKYWFFVKVMGRSASHVTLETALQTQPNIALISEEVGDKKMSLDDVVTSMAETIAQRSAKGKNYGVAIIPEGLLEFIPEMKSLIANLNDIMPELEIDPNFASTTSTKEKFELVENRLGKKNAKVYESLPVEIKVQLLSERDPHGNVQVSQLDTDKLLINMIKIKLDQMKKEGSYTGKFAAISSFSGYDGRSGLPSNFDSDYCYSLGYSAAALVNAGKTGYIATVKNLGKNYNEWEAGGAPLAMMMNLEKRNGEMKPVIKKALVDIDGPVFEEFVKNRDDWALNDNYLCPGPIQFYGPTKDNTTETLKLESKRR